MAKENKETSDAPKVARVGFDDSGKAYPGVDPQTGDRKAVTLAGLKREFGPSKGQRIYEEVARATGAFAPEQVVGNYSPDISLDGLDDKQAEAVTAALNPKE